MNTGWILFHLREAEEELARTIAALEAKADYEEIEFEIAMGHIYNHLNTAWNSRRAESERIAQCSEQDFYAWRAFPSDMPMGQ